MGTCTVTSAPFLQLGFRTCRVHDVSLIVEMSFVICTSESQGFLQESYAVSAFTCDTRKELLLCSKTPVCSLLLCHTESRW